MSDTLTLSPDERALIERLREARLSPFCLGLAVGAMREA